MTTVQTSASRSCLSLTLLLVTAGCTPGVQSDGTASSGTAPFDAIGAASGPTAIDASVFFIGDAGRARPGDQVLQALDELASRDAARSTIVFLGDNLYPDGLDSVGGRRRAAQERLLEQLARVGSGGRVRTVLIPGNHDWRDSKPGGWRSVVDQQEFIDGLGIGTLSFLPKGGCPGPVAVDLGTTVRLVVIDTAWWLYDDEKPGPENSSCANTSTSEFLRALDRELEQGGNRRLLVAAHHPLRSGGPHGGYLGWHDHIFPLRRAASWAWIPLPGVGSLYALVRSLGVNTQDLGSSEYRTMIDSLEGVFYRHDVLAYAAGHEHNLQVIRNPATRYALVSGAGPSTGLTPAAWLEGTAFALQAWGFMRLDVYQDYHVRLRVFAASARGGISEVHSQWLTVP